MTAGKHVIAYMLHLALRRSMCDVIFQMSHSPAFRLCSLIQNVSLICSLNNILHHHPSFVSKNTGSLWASTFKCKTGQLLCCVFFSFSCVFANACFSSFPLKSLQRCGLRSKMCFYLLKRLLIVFCSNSLNVSEIVFLFHLYGKQTSHFSLCSANADIFFRVLKKFLSFVELSSSLILEWTMQHC